MNLPEKIKLLRKRKGISQQELAELTGLNMSYVSRLENGHHEPSIEVIRKMTQIFEVSADYLLNDNEGDLEINIKGRDLADRIRLIESLPDRKKEALMEIIDDMLTNEKLRALLQDKLKVSAG